MVDDISRGESFEAFKNSFFYGSRTDLNFKFLEHLSDYEAANFFQDLLQKISLSYDDGNFTWIFEHVIEWQSKGYAEQEGFEYNEGPFTPLHKPISELRLMLTTSSGHFVEGDDPEPFGIKNMTQEEAIRRVKDFLKEEPKLSSIPVNTPGERMRVRHCGYDIHGAEADPNVVLPLERLRELEKERIIGKLATAAYSFVGACSQKRLLKKTGPKWVNLFKEQKVDAAVLVPV